MAQGPRVIECGRLTAVLLMRRIIVQSRPRLLILGGGESLKPLFFQLFRSRMLAVVKFFLLSDERVTKVKKNSNAYFYFKYLRRLASTKLYLFHPFRLGMRVVPTGFCSENRRHSVAILGLGQDGHVAGLFDQRVSSRIFSFSLGPDGMCRKSLSERFLRSIRRKILYHSGIKDWAITKPKLSTSVVSKLNVNLILVGRKSSTSLTR